MALDTSAIKAFLGKPCALCQRTAHPNGGCPEHTLCESCHYTASLLSTKVGEQLCPVPDCTWREVLDGEDCTKALRPGLGYLELPDEEEARAVTKLIRASMDSVVVEKVRRVRNRTLLESYNQCKERFRLAAAEDEWIVFHGTTRHSSGSIVKNGFDISYAGKAHGQVHGRGIYAGVTAKTSAFYTKEDSIKKHCMFVCTALPGDGKFTRSGNILVFPREQQILPRWIVYYV